MLATVKTVLDIILGILGIVKIALEIKKAKRK